MGFMLVGRSSAPVPWAPPISCPCPAPSSLPHLVSYQGCPGGIAQGEGLLPALHSQPEGTDTLTPLLCPCCRQPACSSISQLDYCLSLKQVRLQTPHNIPTPRLFLARVSPHAFFACSHQRTLAFFAKSLPSTWMQEGKEEKMQSSATCGHWNSKRWARPRLHFSPRALVVPFYLAFHEKFELCLQQAVNKAGWLCWAPWAVLVAIPSGS